MTLSNREISILVWGGIFLVWAFAVPKVRRSLSHLIRTALRWKLVASGLVVILYLVLVVLGLYSIRFWTPALLKDTIVWGLFSGLGFAFSAVNINVKTPTWREVVAKQIKVIVLVEYVMTTYTFGLWIEFLLIPFLTVIIMLEAVARLDKKSIQVAKLTGFLLSASGFAMLFFAVHSALSESFSVADALRDLFLPILLSLALLPIVYLFFLISIYDQLFLLLKLRPGKDPGIIRYSKRRLFCQLGIRPGVVKSFLNRERLALMSVNTKEDIDKLLNRSGRSKSKAD